MKRKRYWVGISFVVVAAAAISLIALPKNSEWTSSSAEALEAFEAGRDAQRKLYYPEALQHFERAVKADPEFVAAKKFLADMLRSHGRDEGDKERAMALYAEVAEADLSGLNVRERFLVERLMAIREHRYEDADELLETCLRDHPTDPFVVAVKADQLWGLGDYDNAERMYRRVLELDPNWVVAYNQLGYLNMLEERFAEAEEYFTSYRFIAPDQANPHDSLGDLYVIQGRYEEAQTSFQRAIEIKPDFSASYDHLALVRGLMGDFSGGHEALQSLVDQGFATESDVIGTRCYLDLWELESDGKWREVRDRAADCLKHTPATHLVTVAAHRAACRLADWELVDEIEAKFEGLLQKAKEKGYKSAVGEAWPLYLHLQGVRLASEGDLDEAEKRFREADAHIKFKEASVGVIKLINRTVLVETLLAQGKDGDAHTLLAKVRAVNPALVADFEEQGLQFLGLERG
jgi:Flp pilus assembly protein TadD